MRALRRDLPAAERATETAAVLQHLRTLVGRRRVMGFVAIKRELDLRPLLEAHSDVVLPRMEGEQLVAAPLTTWEALVPGPFGVPEPAGPATADVEVVLLPGLAFTRHGTRLGYGGGFYDRFLVDRPGALRVAPAFSLQVLPDVPTEHHDQPFDVLVTPSGPLWTGARGRGPHGA